ncbi:MAG TPA: hypothetical protein DCM87_09180 [Planctomycetes bacterium]|nr:hypothetical protein [Planctomycetota bacterium]
MSAAFLALLASCAQEDLVTVRMASLAGADGAMQATTDPAVKNILIRNGTHRYCGMAPMFALPPDRVAGLVRVAAGGYEVRSLDEGIMLSRPDTCDDAPAVLAEPAGRTIWWSGGNEGGDHIYRACSADGYLWHGDDAVLAPSEFTQDARPRDAVHAAAPAVLCMRDTYHLYYAGTAGGTVDNEILLAVSPDGVTWIKYSAGGTPAFPTPVIPNAEPDGTYGIGHPSALVKDGTVYLYFTSRRRGASGLFLATSADGIRFGPPRCVAADIENADVKYCPDLGIFFMAYGEVSDRSIFFNVSADGLSWLPHDRARTIATGGPETVHHSPAIAADGLGHMQPQTRVFYAGGLHAGAALQPESWEIESSWIEIIRRP